MTWLRTFKRNNTFLETNNEVEDVYESESEEDEPEWVKKLIKVQL